MSAPTTPANGRRSPTAAATTAQTPPAGASPAPLAPPPKLRRRPVLVVASIAAVCLGALLAVLAYNSASNAQEVLAVRETVNRGEVIAAEDLLVARVGVDPALRPVGADRAQEIVGQRAALDMPAGGVVTESQVTGDALPPEGASVVGVLATAAMMPAEQLQVGDTVRVITTPGQQGTGPVATDGTTGAAETEPESLDATVAGIVAGADVTGGTVLNLLVDAGDAARLAARVSTGNVAVVLDSSVNGAS